MGLTKIQALNEINNKITEVETPGFKNGSLGRAIKKIFRILENLNKRIEALEK